VIFAGEADGEPRAGDDAAEVGFFSVDALPELMAFDHAEIIRRHTTRVAPPDA
jgi:ADP-ribose pyrophosphatase YjhB (NUDIX family)